jgi:hypothetical protein
MCGLADRTWATTAFQGDDKVWTEGESGENCVRGLRQIEAE